MNDEAREKTDFLTDSSSSTHDARSYGSEDLSGGLSDDDEDENNNRAEFNLVTTEDTERQTAKSTLGKLLKLFRRRQQGSTMVERDNIQGRVRKAWQCDRNASTNPKATDASSKLWRVLSIVHIARALPSFAGRI